ncbi:MAG TPA: DoxX family protein [Geminicoccaceae bacterium]|nr:DoxX family protein [Geminicoccus sp.]HMU49988.1 DoxX family protein [Geminicoccaceae bacterium]
MTMQAVMPACRHAHLRRAVEQTREILDRVPMAPLMLMLRIGVGMVFWKSAMSKLANWDLTVQLFADEYQVPLLPPGLAALLGTTAEVAGAVALILGIGARFGSLALLGVTATIQLFVYPENWSEHLLWASVLLLVLVRGAGPLSIDHILVRALRLGR